MDAGTIAHPPIVFVRHGETDWNAAGRLQGHRDIPLNDRGRGQALRNGQAIAAKFPDIAGFDFVASPLGRASETMEIVRGALGLEADGYRRDRRLMEISYGEWEGMTGEELLERFPDRMAEREADRWGFLPPGGESYHILSERVGAWLATLDRPTVAVSHGGVGRVLRAMLTGEHWLTGMVGVFPQENAFHWRDRVETLI